jgi:hypothetical protein
VAHEVGIAVGEDDNVAGAYGKGIASLIETDPGSAIKKEVEDDDIAFGAESGGKAGRVRGAEAPGGGELSVIKERSAEAYALQELRKQVHGRYSSFPAAGQKKPTFDQVRNASRVRV